MSLVESSIYSITHQSKLLRTTAALLSKYEAKSRWVSSSLSTYVEPMATGFWRYRRAGRWVLEEREMTFKMMPWPFWSTRSAWLRGGEIKVRVLICLLTTMSGRKLNPTELKLHQSALVDPQKVSWSDSLLLLGRNWYTFTSRLWLHAKQSHWSPMQTLELQRSTFYWEQYMLFLISTRWLLICSDIGPAESVEGLWG